MVNEDRLRPMVRMAMLDQGEGKNCKQMVEYTRADYVSKELLKSFVSGTFAFVLMFGMWALSDLERMMSKISAAQIFDFAVAVILRYVVWMLGYLLVTYVVYHLRFTKGRKVVKEYYTNLKQINKIYEREARMKNPSQGDWE